MSRLRLPFALIVALTLFVGCDGVAPEEDAGYARKAKTDTDLLAADLVPAIVDRLSLSVSAMEADFIECDLAGWRYEADGDFVGEVAAVSVTPAVTDVMEAQGLTVEVRDDSSVVGRNGELSVLVGAPSGPPGKAFRHITFKHACAGYSDGDESYARSTDPTDYAELVR